ncbi:MAG: glycosyltransferase [Patescibacteria group bacterium]
MISVVIPAYNDAQRLEKTLRQLRVIREQEYSALEVVVAVRPSEDATLKVANRSADKVVPGGTVSRGRNSGARAASGEIIIFLDADTVPSVGVISAIAQRATKDMIGSVPIFSLEPTVQARLFVWLTNGVRRLGIIQGMSNLLFCHASLLKQDRVWYNEDLSLGEHHDFIKQARRAGKVFTLLPVRPGYYVCEERFKQSGYANSFLFWIHWGIRKLIFRKNVARLEQAYWSKTYQPLFIHRRDWKKAWVFSASTVGVLAGLGVSISSYTGPRRILLHLFLLELQEDPQAPLVHFWLWVMGQMEIETLYGLGLAVMLGSFFMLIYTARNLVGQRTTDLAKVVEK